MSKPDTHDCSVGSGISDEPSLQGFMAGKSDHTRNLFNAFYEAWRPIGPITVHPAKTMIGFAAKKRIAWVIRIGKNFVDVVFPFDQPYNDNLCFHKIARVPGTKQFNHHLRLFQKEDINREVIAFMKLAFEKGKALSDK